ncbi:MAG TPA: class II aldolase/adducin family protein [Pseudolabrys sp.]|jgi:HCOMODA/2-hydroxy-3-carboxy-muconic semialdehyde decarboxylase
MSVPTSVTEAFRELAIANRIVANEGILDAFGHVSMRHPDNPNRYVLSRSRAPELVEPGDLIEYDLDSRPVRDPGATQYSERVIHGEIYKARPDVTSVCHHHAPAFMPLIATGADYLPVFHLGAVGGIRPPYWDQHDEFGDTNMLVIKPEEGASLARALGAHNLVLMRRHGVTAVGTSVRDCVFRSIFSARNAEFQARATVIGTVTSLSRGEAELAAKINTSTTGLTRSWEYWLGRLGRAGLMVPETKAVPNRGRAPVKASSRGARKAPSRKKARRR